MPSNHDIQIIDENSLFYALACSSSKNPIAVGQECYLNVGDALHLNPTRQVDLTVTNKQTDRDTYGQTD